MTISSLNTPVGEPHFFAMKIDRPGVRTQGLLALRILSFLLALFVFAACEASQHSTTASPLLATAEAAPASVKPKELRMWMSVGEQRFSITLSDNETARALTALMPLTLDMSEHNGNEKYASLPRALPTKANRPGTIHNGDLMLFGSQTLVVFYVTADTSYSYTRIGRVDDPAGLASALGRRDVRVVFSKN